MRICLHARTTASSIIISSISNGVSFTRHITNPPFTSPARPRHTSPLTSDDCANSNHGSCTPRCDYSHASCHSKACDCKGSGFAGSLCEIKTGGGDEPVVDDGGGGVPASTVMLILLLIVIVVAGVASWVKRKPLKVRRGEERGRRGEREKREGKRERRGTMAERIHPRWRAVPCVVPCVVYTNIGLSPVVFVYVFIPWCNSSFPSPHYSIVHRITSSYYRRGFCGSCRRRRTRTWVLV